MEYHAYLAGPDVFYPDAVARGKYKKDYLKKLGINAYFPLDNDLLGGSGFDLAMAIANANEGLMRTCCREGRVGIILANMEPWHGPSTDVGTAFEIGFMSALAARGTPVVIVGYSKDQRLFAERVQQMHYGEIALRDAAGRLVGDDGLLIEDFGLADNLMLINAIEKTGGCICASFEDAAEAALNAARLLEQSLTTPNRGVAA